MSGTDNLEAKASMPILGRVRELAPRFRERVPATEAARAVPAESIAELVDAGVARMMVPARFGGLDMRIRDLCEVTAAVAQACPSTGWLTCLMAGVPHNFAQFPLEAQQALWANGPDVITAGSLGVTATPVEGGFEISGRSPFSSGVNNAKWVYLVGGIRSEGGPPELKFFMVPISDCTVLDTWETVAMRGTASNTIVTERVFVPEAFTVSLAEVRDGRGSGVKAHENPIFRLPWAAYSALGFASTLLGATEGAFEEVTRLLKEKRDPAGRPATDSEVLQVGVGLAAAQIRTARMIILSSADRADADPSFDTLERAAAMLDFSYATKLLKQALGDLLELAGTGGFATSSMVQQFWRDGFFAAAHQGLNSRISAGYYGRLTLEVENPQRPMFY